jgi:predicted RNase H-related nuclease YkuK (DUF458 family)
MIEELKFHFSNGKMVDDLKNYVKEYLKKYPNVELFIGTDSQKRRRRKVSYVTTICFRHPGDGVHILHYRKVESYKKDLFSKLWKEVELSIETASMIKDVVDNLTIDLDLNSLKKYESNVAHDAAKGYVIAMGYGVRTKPTGWAASHAADHLSKR